MRDDAQSIGNRKIARDANAARAEWAGFTGLVAVDEEFLAIG